MALDILTPYYKYNFLSNNFPLYSTFQNNTIHIEERLFYHTNFKTLGHLPVTGRSAFVDKECST